MHALAFAHDGAQAAYPVGGKLELAVLFLQGQLLELLFADIHDEAFQITGITILVIDGLSLVPDPFDLPCRQVEAVHELVGRMRDNTVAYPLLDHPQVGRRRHALKGVEIVPDQFFRRHAQQVDTAAAGKFKHGLAVIIVDFTAIRQAGKMVEEAKEGRLPAVVGTDGGKIHSCVSPVKNVVVYENFVILSRSRQALV